MMSPDKTVYLVDSSIYIYRAWQTFPDSISDAAGNPLNAVYGFAEFLIQLLQQTDAKFVVCAFDESTPTSLRKALYPDYKKSRGTTPAPLRLQFKLCQAVSEQFGVTAIASGDHEADDVIGTLAESMRAQAMNVCIVSADKDLTQFIRSGDEFWDYARKIKTDAKGIQKRFRVKPEQIADMLALSGDKVDNIPGVPGVGFAAAARLLVKWGTLDTLFEHTDAVANMKFRGAPVVAEQLKQHEATVRLSRKLTGLIPMTKLPETQAELTRQPVDMEALERFLFSLGFDEDQRQQLTKELSAVL